MIPFLLSLCITAIAAPPKVDTDAVGNIITVRPLEDHTVAVLDADGTPFQLPDAMSQPMWLVHPEAWRQAVALAARVDAEQALVPELKKELARLEEMVATEKKIRSEIRLELEASEASHAMEAKMLRRSRIHWTIGVGSAMAVVGVAVGVFVVP